VRFDLSGLSREGELFFVGKIERYPVITGRKQAPDASSRSAVRPASPTRRGKAEETRAEQSDRGRLGYLSKKFGDHDLAVAGLEIGHQDLVGTGVEGAAAKTGTNAKMARVVASAPAAVATPTASTTFRTGGATATTAKPATGKIWKRITTGAGKAGNTATRTKKAAAASVGATTGATTITVGAAIRNLTDASDRGTTAVGTGQAALAGVDADNESGTPAASAGDNQRSIPGANYERTTAAATVSVVAAHSTNGDL
jgi:hypothetical protein